MATISRKSLKAVANQEKDACLRLLEELKGYTSKEIKECDLHIRMMSGKDADISLSKRQANYTSDLQSLEARRRMSNELLEGDETVKTLDAIGEAWGREENAYRTGGQESVDADAEESGKNIDQSNKNNGGKTVSDDTRMAGSEFWELMDNVVKISQKYETIIEDLTDTQSGSCDDGNENMGGERFPSTEACSSPNNTKLTGIRISNDTCTEDVDLGLSHSVNANSIGESTQIGVEIVEHDEGMLVDGSENGGLTIQCIRESPIVVGPVERRETNIGTSFCARISTEKEILDNNDKADSIVVERVFNAEEPT